MEEEKLRQTALVLKEIIEWWETWTTSENPTELEDPPITEAKLLLTEIGY